MISGAIFVIIYSVDLLALSHNRNYVVMPFLTSQQPQLLDLPSMYLTAFHRVYACRVHAAMPQNVRQSDNVLLQAVISSRKEVSKIVRKDFLFADVCFFTKFLHITPNIRPIQRFAVFRYEHGTAFSVLRLAVGFQNFAEFTGEIHDPSLALVVHLGVFLL